MTIASSQDTSPPVTIVYRATAGALTRLDEYLNTLYYDTMGFDNDFDNQAAIGWSGREILQLLTRGDVTELSLDDISYLLILHYKWLYDAAQGRNSSTRARQKLPSCERSLKVWYPALQWLSDHGYVTKALGPTPARYYCRSDEVFSVGGHHSAGKIDLTPEHLAIIDKVPIHPELPKASDEVLGPSGVTGPSGVSMLADLVYVGEIYLCFTPRYRDATE